MNDKILAKLVKIAAKQQKIIEKLAQGLTVEDSKRMAEEESQKKLDIESDLREATNALSGETQEMGEFDFGDDKSSGLPPDFDEKFEHYLGQKNSTSHFGRTDYRHNMNQFHALSEGDPSMWAELGEYFVGWTPEHITQLMKKLHSA